MPGKPIDADFFANYAGSKNHYNRVYRQHNYLEECLELFAAADAPQVRSCCVLGSGTGVMLKDLYRAFGQRPYGCEINEWAFRRTPAFYRGRIHHEDMLSYVNRLRRKGRHFDLVFSNSLIYLRPKDLAPLLGDLAHVARYLHFRSSFKGEFCPDPYRRILESYTWWNRQMARAGFEELLTPFGNATYLWRSKALS
ncbi:MAG: hypothetical protein JST16_18945 [Bdellovibrionales bacterium]|nr:hypothetical protein [Bdellovibrionales bacterium]